MPYTQCHLCGDRGARVPAVFQTNVIDISAEEATTLDPILGSALQLGLMSTCKMMEAYLYSLDEDKNTCSGFSRPRAGSVRLRHLKGGCAVGH